MSRDYVDKASLYAETLPASYLILVEIEHSSFDETIRIVKNPEEIVFGANTYSPFPFEATLPGDTGDTPGVGKMTISNVDYAITRAIRGISTAVTVNLYVVLSTDLTDVQSEYLGLSGKSVSYNASVVTLSLSYENVLNTRFPSKSYNLSTFPNLK